MAADLTIKGGAELAQQLAALPDRIANNVMRGAVLNGAGVIRDRARVLAPILAEEELAKRNPSKLRVALSRKHAAAILARGGDVAKANAQKVRGLLRRSIFAARGRGSRDTVVAIIGVGKAAFYGRFVEFGTRKMSARPFMRPAFNQAGQEAVDAVVEYASGRVEEEAARNG